MDAFLKLVVEDLKRKHGDNLTDLTVVFPNNRARLFFNRFMMEGSQAPMWAPSYTTIQDLFLSCTHLQVADEMKLVCELFRVYVQKIDWEELGIPPETMDDFYFWGTSLLSDFEDIDNNLVDAKQLFQNIKDLANLDGDLTDILDDEQREALRKFFGHFKDEKGDSIIKKKFAALWNAMYPIYDEFRKNLKEKGIAYGGMAHRLVVGKDNEEREAKIDMDRFRSKRYVFVGFNVLNKCEVAFFKAFQNAGKALFYWDVDDFYMSNKNDVEHEAATFMKQNLANFPNELGKNLGCFAAQEKKFTIISSSTQNAQAKYLGTYLSKLTGRSEDESGNENKKEKVADSDIAVVLCDESMLLPSLHSIPGNEVNITMGLPLIQTPIYSMIKALLEMRSIVATYESSVNVPFRFIKEVLANPYVRRSMQGTTELYENIVSSATYYPSAELLTGKSEDTSLLFSFLREKQSGEPASMLNWLLQILKKVSSLYYEKAEKDKKDRQQKRVHDSNEEDQHPMESIYDALYMEALFRCYTIVNRVYSLVETGDLTVNIQTLCKLLERILSTTSVPFSGEPVQGLQVMGFLETRNLDFKHVVMLSVNEGILPKGGGESSFIPYSLRKGFGMTTIEHKNSLYAYYFYRLLQRAETATFMFSSATNGGSKGLMSRFLMQLIVEKGEKITIQQKDLRSDIEVALENKFEVAKTKEVVEILRKKYDQGLSGDQAKMMSPTMLNTYLACPMKFYFTYVLGLDEPKDLDETIDQRVLGNIVHKTLENIYNKYKGKSVDGAVIQSWIESPLNLEKEVDNAFRTEYFNCDGIAYSGQQLLLKTTVTSYVKNALSMDLTLAPFTVIQGEKRVSIKMEVDGMQFELGGVVDRLQMSEGIFQVIDYKTGSQPKEGILFKEGFPLLFSPNVDRHYYAYALQVWIYSYILYKNESNSAIPYLMFVRSKKGLVNPTDKKDVKLCLSGDNATEICGEIEDLLKEKIREIFSMEQSFKMTSDPKNCGFCPFVEICQGKKIGRKSY